METKFNVTRVVGGKTASFDTLAVAKITNYPLEKGSYRPYAQASFYINDDYYMLRMMSFEAITTPESTLRTVLYPFVKNSSLALHIVLTTDKAVSFVKKEGGLAEVPIEAHRHSGEDLQGVYWGWDINISINKLAEHGKVYNEAGQAMLGNFYKTQEIEPEHYGSFAKANFGSDPYERESTCKFAVVAY